ncbi:putative ABC transport system ATP-binding protein [Amycolatopsis sacchari]|uniref:Putative ABC transport system ATP-binding protein n=1 Tax=Amycolatopsis sacchari TaxID=115433 RepID=A0A1I3RE40_9PSEU|nr:ABC transporter ATP-binding protein [Amycolatopsis sacchari]SFJ44863.1 putative ABC transport system ATP-binding protein [Amycolatopsis sacchari]
MGTAAVRARGLRCRFEGEAGPVDALRGVDLEIGRGSFVAIMGPSGSGKTTLLHCAAGLRTPTAGTVRLDGTDLAALDETALAELRRRRVGFVFQSFNLLPALTATENVELPLRLDSRKPDPRRTAALLARVGLANRGEHRPGQLSGGQKQRVAVARALITEPEVVFADEPTGALDIRSAREVLGLLRGLADQGQTIIMVTHDPVAASFSDEVLFLADGLLVDRMPRPSAAAVAGRMATLVESAERAAMGVA